MSNGAVYLLVRLHSETLTQRWYAVSQCWISKGADFLYIFLVPLSNCLNCSHQPCTAALKIMIMLETFCRLQWTKTIEEQKNADTVPHFWGLVNVSTLSYLQHSDVLHFSRQQLADKQTADLIRVSKKLRELKTFFLGSLWHCCWKMAHLQKHNLNMAQSMFNFTSYTHTYQVLLNVHKGECHFVVLLKVVHMPYPVWDFTVNLL